MADEDTPRGENSNPDDDLVQAGFFDQVASDTTSQQCVCGAWFVNRGKSQHLQAGKAIANEFQLLNLARNIGVEIGNQDIDGVGVWELDDLLKVSSFATDLDVCRGVTGET